VIRESRYLRLLRKQKLMFSRPTSGNFDIWEVNMLDDLAFGSAVRLDALSTEEFWESGPSVSPDGLEVFFNRSAPNGPFDIYYSTRREPDQPWSTPVNLGAPVNIPASSDAGASRSPDGAQLYFESNRPGGLGNADIWVSTRIGAR
jgi:Tol biopolymer transport system component